MVGDSKYQLAWSSVRYSHKTKKKRKVTYHSCIGRFECPEPGCDFAANSAQPQAVKGRSLRRGICPDKPLFQSTCIHHNVPLRHTGICPAFWTREVYPPTEEYELGRTVIKHHRKHNHQEPPNEMFSNSATVLTVASNMWFVLIYLFC